MSKTVKPSILFFLHTHAIGGVEKQSKDLLTFLNKHWSIRLFVHEKDIAQKISLTNVDTTAFWMGRKIGGMKTFLLVVLCAPYLLIRYFFLLLHNRCFSQPQVVIVHALNEKFLVSLPAKLLGYTVIWIDHGPLRSWISGMPLSVYKRCSNFADKIIAVSETTKQDLVAVGASPSKITVIVNGVEFPLDISPKTIPLVPTLLFVGRLVERKGLSTVLHAMKLLQDKGRNCSLTIVGDGEDRGKFEDEARLLQVASSVQFTGWKESIDDEYKKADIIINPSLYEEGFGLTVIEAFFAHRPVIASRSGALAELISDNKTGKLFTSGNYLELADAIEQILDNKPLCKAIVEQAYVEATQKYTLSIMLEQYNQVLNHYLKDIPL